MFITSVLSYLRAWETLQSEYPGVLIELRAAIAEITPDLLTGRSGSQTMAHRSTHALNKRLHNALVKCNWMPEPFQGYVTNGAIIYC
jgi:hypothetical protein